MSKSPDFTVYYYVCGTFDGPRRVRIGPDSHIIDLCHHVADDCPTLVKGGGHWQLTLYKSVSRYNIIMGILLSVVDVVNHDGHDVKVVSYALWLWRILTVG